MLLHPFITAKLNILQGLPFLHVGMSKRNVLVITIKVYEIGWPVWVIISQQINTRNTLLKKHKLSLQPIEFGAEKIFVYFSAFHNLIILPDMYD